MAKYFVEAFDKETELLVFEVELPLDCDESLRIIMGWTAEQQGWEGYDLGSFQLTSIEKLLGKQICDPACDFQLCCNL